MLIKDILLKQKVDRRDERPARLPVAHVNVIVGPNNSGKSQFLRELNTLLWNGQHNAERRSIDTIFLNPIAVDAEGLLRRFVIDSHQIEGGRQFSIRTVGSAVEGIKEHKLNAAIQQTNESGTLSPVMADLYTKNVTLVVQGGVRTDRVGPMGFEDLRKNTNENKFVKMLLNPEVRAPINVVLKDAFNKVAAFDLFTKQIRAHLVPALPEDNPEFELHLGKATAAFFEKTEPLETASDGVKAFFGLVTELMAGDPEIFIIDEPEAFLHPNLAFKLAYHMTRLAKEKDKTCFAVTHSNAFLRGVMAADAGANIVRFDRLDDRYMAHVVPVLSMDLLRRDRLLQSLGALDAIFYSRCVVLEGESDKIVFELGNSIKGFPLSDTLFLSASSNANVAKLLGVVRSFETPSACVLDFDCLAKGEIWSGLFKAAGVPDAEREGLIAVRTRIGEWLRATNTDIQRTGLSFASVRDAFGGTLGRFLQTLSEFGIFVLPTGSLESISTIPALQAADKDRFLNTLIGLIDDQARREELLLGLETLWSMQQQLKVWFAS